MENIKELPVWRIQLDETEFASSKVQQDEDLLPIEEVEFEILPPVDITDPRKLEIYKRIADVDESLDKVNERVDELNREIDLLTCHADGLDYAVAVGSGILTGLIDSFFVGEFSLERGSEWSNKKVNGFVEKAAKMTGYKGNDLDGAIKHLENKFHSPGDLATSKFGGGKQHHLRDFSHHPTLAGLFFSMLTQFTECVYGTDVNGVFKVEHLTFKSDIQKKLYIGENLPTKISLGVIHWFFHLVSDMAGTSSTAGAGTGIPGPLLSLAKELAALPFFRDLSIKEKNPSEWISKLFNGTLLAKRDKDGKILTGANGKPELIKFDLRTEIGLAYEIGRQAIPVVINECIVRGFYFIRRFVNEIKEKEIHSIAELNKINWSKTLPFKNRTIVRMITISSATFTAFDLIDAAIRAIIETGGINAATLGKFILRVNFVGVGRLAVAVITDVSMGVKKNKAETERIRLNNVKIQLSCAKVFYKQADMWIEAENAGQAIDKAYSLIPITAESFVSAWNEVLEGADRRTEYITKIKDNDSDFANELLYLLEWR